jgi:hypothetical protein
MRFKGKQAKSHATGEWIAGSRLMTGPGSVEVRTPTRTGAGLVRDETFIHGR